MVREFASGGEKRFKDLAVGFGGFVEFGSTDVSVGK
jgi:hypothetical protein